MAGKTLSMALALLTVASASPSSHTVPETARLSPSALAIYYGYPSLVNGASGNVERAARDVRGV